MLQVITKSVRYRSGNPKIELGKAPGKDGILAEQLKFGGNALLNIQHRLILKIWEQEEIPESCKETIIIVPIHKKGDVYKYENYRLCLQNPFNNYARLT